MPEQDLDQEHKSLRKGIFGFARKLFMGKKASKHSAFGAAHNIKKYRKRRLEALKYGRED